MSTLRARVAVAVSLLLAVAVAGLPAEAKKRPQVKNFRLVASFPVVGEVAESVTASADGKTLIYTDSQETQIGFADITDFKKPTAIKEIPVQGEPTSVATTRDGRWVLAAVADPDQLVVIDVAARAVETTILLDGDPDAVTVAPSGTFAAIANENQRDESLDGGAMPQPPPGFVTIVDLEGEPSSWTTRIVDVTGIADRFPEDPEPEFIDINEADLAAVTLQENNHIVVIDLETGEIVDDFSAGESTHAADLDDDGRAQFDDTLSARREPDGIHWTSSGSLITANEGDYDVDTDFVGGRDFTVWTTEGEILFQPGADLEKAAAEAGVYPDDRSEVSGIEPEGVEIARYRNRTFVFIGAERAHFVAVYRMKSDSDLELVNLVATGQRPEGLLAIPSRRLFITANEDSGTIDVFRAILEK